MWSRTWTYDLQRCLVASFSSGIFLLKAAIFLSLLPLLVALGGEGAVLAWAAMLLLYLGQRAALWKRSLRPLEGEGEPPFSAIYTATALGLLGNVYFHTGALREVLHLWKYDLDRRQTFSGSPVEFTVRSCPPAWL